MKPYSRRMWAVVDKKEIVAVRIEREVADEYRFLWHQTTGEIIPVLVTEIKLGKKDMRLEKQIVKPLSGILCEHCGTQKRILDKYCHSCEKIF